jgi:hypothetical protein
LCLAQSSKANSTNTTGTQTHVDADLNVMNGMLQFNSLQGDRQVVLVLVEIADQYLTFSYK